MVQFVVLRGALLAGSLCLLGCGATASRSPAAPGSVLAPSPGAPAPQVLDEIVISPHDARQLEEAFRRGQDLLLSDRFAEAAALFDRLVRFSPNGPTAPPSLFNAGLAYLSLGDRARAVERFAEQIRRFPAEPITKNAILRSARIYAYLERWGDLGLAADRLLARDDLAVLEQIEAHGAKGLSLVELGQVDEGFRHVMSARDLIEDHKLGQAGAPPMELAQVAFALGEVRRIKSERLIFTPLPDDFAAVLEQRCQGLLDAQSAYTDAMRSLDAHWSAMAGYRVGQLYQQLHRDVIAIPPPPQATSLRQKQLFEGAMRLRYRVLLEKGLKMMEATVRLGERTGESSAWVTRAAEAKRDLELALADEAKAMSKLPFTEEELQAALDELKGR